MNTSWIVTAIGAIFALIGWYLVPDKWGYGLIGFGWAHMILGMLDGVKQPDRSRV